MRARVWLASAIAVLSISCASLLRADDDTLRDLGTAAAPGEIPKWDGNQWRNAHDNITDVRPGEGLAGSMTNGQITLGVVFSANGTSNVAARVDHNHSDLEATRPPVGAVVAWVKSLPSTPQALPSSWAECNGQILDDTNSVYHGQSIPLLNGSTDDNKRFLRGARTSGVMGGSAGHGHGSIGFDGFGSIMAGAPNGASHIPPYYEVVWIMRVK